MKNPMIEANINADLFEAIDENTVNGGLSMVGNGNKYRLSFSERECCNSSAITPTNDVSIRAYCLTVITTDNRCNNQSVRFICAFEMKLK